MGAPSVTPAPAPEEPEGRNGEFAANCARPALAPTHKVADNQQIRQKQREAYMEAVEKETRRSPQGQVTEIIYPDTFSELKARFRA